MQSFALMPRLTYKPKYIFKCIRRSNSFGPSVIQFFFFWLALFHLHTNGKRCNQEGFRPCYSQIPVVYAYHVLSVSLQGFVWSKYCFWPFLGPDIITEMGVVIYVYLNIPQIILIPNIYGFMGLTPLVQLFLLKYHF